MAKSRFSNLDFSNSNYINEYLKKTKPKQKAPANDAGRSLYYMREVELEPTMAVQLLPFIRAYAPHGSCPTAEYLESLGYERKVEERSFREECEEVYLESRGCTPEEWVRLHPDDESDDTE